MSNNNMNNERNFAEDTMKKEIENIEYGGVRYVNTTHKEFTNIMYGRHQDNASDFNLSAIKVNEYKCDLGPTPDDASKDWGAIYLFPHYLIKSPKYRIELDNTDLVDITYICTYNELLTVLIDKKDMSCIGFNRFIIDTMNNMLFTVNGCKIPKTRDPEDYLSYRQLMMMICFVNKYNEYLNILPYRFKNVLVHTLVDNEECHYRRYVIATIAENDNIVSDVVNNNLATTAKKTINSDDYRDGNPNYKYEVDMNFTKISDKIDYEIASHDTFKSDLVTYYDGNFRKLVKEFNEKADEIGIEEAWKEKVGFIILKYIDYIAEFNNGLKPMKFSVDDNKHLCFAYDVEIEKPETSKEFALEFSNMLLHSNYTTHNTAPDKPKEEYHYSPDDFKVDDDYDYIINPGDEITIRQ